MTAPSGDDRTIASGDVQPHAETIRSADTVSAPPRKIVVERSGAREALLRERRPWLVMCAVGACNQAFEVRSTRLVDAPPPDASPRCPEFGETPDFSGTLRQVIAQPCRDYTFSSEAGRATATCDLVIMEGSIAEPLVPAIGVVAPTPEWLEQPRLFPDASRMIVRHIIPDPGSETLEVFDLVGDRWQFRETLTAFGEPTWVSNVVSSAGGYRLLTVNGADLEEWEYADAWQRLRVTPVANLGLAAAGGPILAPDGSSIILHAIDPSLGQYRPYYSDRASQADAFGPARPLAGLVTPNDRTIMVSDACTGAYLTGLDGVFFVRRR